MILMVTIIVTHLSTMQRIIHYFSIYFVKYSHRKLFEIKLFEKIDKPLFEFHVK
jgi:hypothetical protein